MPHLNRLFNVSINDVSINGSVNMGNAFHQGYSANSEGTGGQSIVGNEFYAPPTHDFNLNLNNDNDIVDQPQKQV